MRQRAGMGLSSVISVMNRLGKYLLVALPRENRKGGCRQ